MCLRIQCTSKHSTRMCKMITNHRLGLESQLIYTLGSLVVALLMQKLNIYHHRPFPAGFIQAAFALGSVDLVWLVQSADDASLAGVPCAAASLLLYQAVALHGTSAVF